MTNIKKYTEVAAQIELLRKRGMVVDDGEAKHWLSHVNYYRLSGYWFAYRREDAAGQRLDEFDEGTSFHDVTRLYEFDRKLRVLVLDALGRLEVALRRSLSDHLGAIDPLAYALPELKSFRQAFDHAKWIGTATERVDRAAKHSPFVKHQITKYDGITIWILTEVLDFRDLSLLYDGLTGADQRKVAIALGVDIDIDAIKGAKQRQKAAATHPLARWLQQFCIVRNVCAHHGRLWNTQAIPVSTVALRTIPQLTSLPSGQSSALYGALLLTAHMMSTISPGSTWAARVRNLIETELLDLPMRSAQEMGFPVDWQEQALWNDGASGS